MNKTRNLPLLMIRSSLIACCCVLLIQRVPFGNSAWITTITLSLFNAICSSLILMQAEKTDVKKALFLVLIGKGIKAALIFATLALYFVMLPKAERFHLIFPFGAAYCSVLLIETFFKTKTKHINLKESVLP